MTEQDAGISEIRMVTLSVGDLDASLRFYRDGLGWLDLGRDALDPRWSTAWGAPDGTEVATLAADERRLSLLRLVAVPEPGEQIWDGRKMYDHGHFALNFHARDVDGLLPRLKELGLRPPPWIDGEVTTTRWDLAAVTVVDSMFGDPDGTLIDLFTIVRGAESFPSFSGPVSGHEAMAIHTGDMTTSQAFYEGFGHTPLYAEMVDPPPFLGMGEGTRVHNVNLRMGDTMPGRVELVRHHRVDGAVGDPLGSRAMLPQRGILSISFETDDLDRAGARWRELGARPRGGVVTASLPGLGTVQAQTYLGPDDEALELFRRDDTN